MEMQLPCYAAEMLEYGAGEFVTALAEDFEAVVED
jgi:hypothetical protein